MQVLPKYLREGVLPLIMKMSFKELHLRTQHLWGVLQFLTNVQTRCQTLVVKHLSLVETLYSLSCTITHVLSALRRIAAANCSMHNANNKGEKGAPLADPVLYMNGLRQCLRASNSGLRSWVQASQSLYKWARHTICSQGCKQKGPFQVIKCIFHI